MGERRIGVGRDRRLEILDAPRQVLRSAAVPVVAAAQIVIVRADAASAASQKSALAGVPELYAQSADNGPCDLFLDGEHVLHATFKCLRPQVHASSSIDQLGAHA